MALRRPIAFSTLGFLEEVPNGDALNLFGDIAMNDNFITGLADPVNDQDAANKRYVMGLVNGLDWKNSVRLATVAALPACTAAGTGVGKTLTGNANGALSVDGVAVALNDRVLVKDEVAGADNGLYLVTQVGSGGTPFILTRTTDADSNLELNANATVFVSAGTLQDTGWTLTTNDPIVIDTTSLAFAQVSTAVAYSFNAGLLNTSGAISVELDTGANAQGAGADGGSSGLEFDVTGVAGKLRAAVHATGGLERSASGLAAKLNGDTLASGASGLSVIHAPQVRETTFISAEALAQFDPVYITSTVNRVGKCLSNDDAKCNVVGINITSGIAGAAQALNVVETGLVTGVLAGATAGTPYYLQAAGGIGTAIPGAGNQVIQVGIAKNATDLLVQIRFFVKRAA